MPAARHDVTAPINLWVQYADVIDHRQLRDPAHYCAVVYKPERIGYTYWFCISAAGVTWSRKCRRLNYAIDTAMIRYMVCWSTQKMVSYRIFIHITVTLNTNPFVHMADYYLIHKHPKQLCLNCLLAYSCLMALRQSSRSGLRALLFLKRLWPWNR